MFYALAEPYFTLERAGKICFITNRLNIKQINNIILHSKIKTNINCNIQLLPTYT